MNNLRESARYCLLGVIALGVVTVTAMLALYPVRLTLNTLTLMLLGALLGSRTIRVSPRVNMSVCHPFIFAAMVLEGPNEALLVAMVNVLGAGVLRARPMTPYQVSFNISAVAASAAASWFVYTGLLRASVPSSLEQAVLPVLAASVVFFLANTWLVASVVALEKRVGIANVWHENFLWSAPSFITGGALGLLMAHYLGKAGQVSLLLALPFCYLIYYSYRLYMDRLREEKRRLEMVEKLNRSLEGKVRERTDELERLNDRLRASNSRLAEANRLKSEFLANVSHELRTPLNAVIGFSELLLSDAVGELKEEQREFIGDIHSSGTNLLELINDILDLSKIEAGRWQLQIEPCDPVELATAAVSMVRVQASNKGIDVTLEADESVREMQADAGKIKQTLWNLLSNAIKFTPEWGSVTVSVAPADDSVIFAVEDTGVGIPQQELHRIFDEFYQVDGSYTRRYSGTGLGLSLVKKFVELQGGEIRVTSTQGKGSRFEFVLPMEVDPALQTASRTASKSEASSEAADAACEVAEDGDGQACSDPVPDEVVA